MKLLTFDGGKGPSLGALIEDKVLDLNASFEMGLGGDNGGLGGKRLDMLSFLDLGEEGVGQAQKAWTEARRILVEGRVVKGALYDLEDVKVLAPISRPRKNIVCLGLNYADHVREGRREGRPERPLPQHPIYFTKPPTAVTGPFDDIVYPRATERLDYEVELALVIGKEGKYIPEDEVYDHIAGYTVFNDVSARDLQGLHGQWFKGKSCDTFAPMGPYLVTSDEVGDPQNLDVALIVNGETRQSSNTANMIFDIKKIVSVLSTGITLEVGDVIATGTPSGVGSSHPSGFLNVGDVVEAKIEKLGSLVNKVVKES